MTDEDLAALEGLMPDLDDEESGADILADALVPSYIVRDDPSLPPYPRGFVLDILLKTRPLTELLQAYDVSVEEFKRIAQHPVFRQDMRDMSEKLKEEGFSFRVKAQAQAEQYLQQAWKMVHDPEVPANVRADLIKWTTKVAALEPTPTSLASDLTKSLPQMAAALKEMPAEELEMRAYSIIMKKAKNPASEGVTYDG